MTLTELRNLVYTSLAESSSDSFFTSTTIDRWINMGYQRMLREAWNYEKSTVLVTYAQGAEVSPGSFRYTADSGTTYTNRTSEVTDGSGVTLAAIGGLGTLAQGDWVVIGHSAPFNSAEFTIVGANVTATTVTASVWSGSEWVTMTTTDGTSASSISLAQSGTISWDPPPAWPTNTIDGYTGFHIRLTFSAGLNVATSVSEVTITSDGSRFISLPSDFRSTKMVTFDGNVVEPVAFQYFDHTQSPSVGTPYLYAIRESRIYLDPIPNKTGGYLQMWYYAIPADLTASDSPVIPSDYHSYLADYAVHRALMVDGLADQAQFYLQNFLEGRDSLKKYDPYMKTQQDFKQVRQEW